ncbi:myelin expression factor 2-like [Dendronephthya gigantea]|uniref:myelin expression factor 2-like n=1 Tax=Dendronephthya gigantea TaxID=151771 RepID=UPI00106C44EC|nr:myelin expression factor 2-like [Dendronephthya gigantea]XP_028416772.1 myelin expression factor 2-like [Dendronephthya gigantea]
MSYQSERDNLMSDSVEKFKEIARQIENEEHGRGDDRETSNEREFHRSNFERERNLDSSHSHRYQPYSTSKSDRESRLNKRENRVYVYNLPFSLKWQDLKDHMKKVGDVVFAEIMEDSSGRSKGCGVVEFTSSEDAQRAIRELNDTNLGGRLMKIREDHQDRDERPRRPRERSSRDRDSSSSSGNLGSVAGLSMLGLGQLGLLQQMSSKSDAASCSVFVSNLDYRVTWAKLKDTFKAAGRVVRADVAEDNDKKSKGHGTVQFETPLEAINAVFIMNGKSIYDRSMNVRLDRESPFFSLFGGHDGGKSTSSLSAAAGLQSNMPSLSSLTSLAGLSNMGGLGGGINPLALLQLQNLQSQMNNMSGLGSMAGLGNMAGLSGLAGFGSAGMNLGTGSGTSSLQSSQADTSSLSSAAFPNASSMNTANGNMVGGASNPYALWMQQLYGMQGYGGFQGSFAGTDTQQQQNKGDPAKQVFVRNLPWKVTWQDLKDKFREAGRVVRADVLMDDSKRSKGCGTVLFESEEEAARAVSSFNGTMMDGREIEVRMDRG